jgi:hypothetical protein
MTSHQLTLNGVICLECGVALMDSLDLRMVDNGLMPLHRRIDCDEIQMTEDERRRRHEQFARSRASFGPCHTTPFRSTNLPDSAQTAVQRHRDAWRAHEEQDDREMVDSGVIVEGE